MSELSSEEIALLPPPVRMAGYLRRVILADELGAILRSTKEDEDWTAADDAAWELAMGPVSRWFHASSREERAFLAPARSVMAAPCRGEGP